ncbi:hypothetical protein E1B28_000837 [Marasmius oreades]|uniref:ribonuclease T2 n=1 Tax=Marasmius oreades TaxID=181124 RepID=A0A9P7V2D8_9AGAR|nr:uncharacterized protein E1B28_000837 [Marasmius oreades]KAG7098947.1 hypothetical protein E1B28_000837 [Marasmius oreades]
MRRYSGLYLALSGWTVVSALANCAVSPTHPNLSACALEPLTFSCENTTAIKNTCCTPTPGGLVLQTQFWSTFTGREDAGQKLPKGSWTIHGLWPDNCDGSFEQYCDPSRQYDPAPSPQAFPNGTEIPAYRGPGIDTFIEKFKRYDLLDYMNKYWIAQSMDNAIFWAHEYSKHATCTSTFDIQCYGDSYEDKMEVVDFFHTATRVFQQYPTFDILAANGIMPSNKTGYPLHSIQNALRTQTGATPYLGCLNRTILTEVWYFSHVLGTVSSFSVRMS